MVTVGTAISLCTLACSSAAIVASYFDPKGKLIDGISRTWAFLILKAAGAKITVSGHEHLEPGRPYVVIANHASHFDVPVLVKAMPGLQLRWVAKKELTKVPVFGWAIQRAGHIIIDRSDRDAAYESMRRAGERIRGGTSVMVFAEGTRSVDGRMGPFKKGGFILAREVGVPVLPVTICGSWRIHRRDTWRINPGPIDVVIGDPVDPSEDASGKMEELIEGVRRTIVQMAEAGLDEG